MPVTAAQSTIWGSILWIICFLVVFNVVCLAGFLALCFGVPICRVRDRLKKRTCHVG